MDQALENNLPVLPKAFSDLDLYAFQNSRFHWFGLENCLELTFVTLKGTFL